jgi:membrane protein DedA with SNARE-associated domain
MIADAIERADYLGITALMLVAPPLPSELVLPFAGFYVARQGLFLPLAIAAATAGSLGHALAVYYLARGGRGLRARAKGGGSGRRLGQVEDWFGSRGPRIVLFGRMLSGVRWLVGIPAGLTRMPLRVYVPLTLVGCAGWNTLLMISGSALGSSYGDIGGMAKVATLALLVLLATVLLVRRAMSPARR